jgi:hypothetical protein
MAYSIGYMSAATEEWWLYKFKYRGLYRHPKWMSPRDRQRQRRLLNAVSANPNALPLDEKLNIFWQWHNRVSDE